MPSKVLLLKAADDKYAAAFQRPTTQQQDGSHGVVSELEAHFVDVLTFEYVNTQALQDALTHLDAYSGILVTSPRGAIAITNAVQALQQQDRGDEGVRCYEQVLEQLRRFPIYSVGRATSRELDVLGITCLGDESGSAELLAEHLHKDGVLSEEIKTKPMLFTCGEKRSDVLPESFSQRGLPFEELVVYKSCAVSNIQLPEDCAQPQWVVFFSPSGLKAMKNVDLTWAAVRKAAIGA